MQWTHGTLLFVLAACSSVELHTPTRLQPTSESQEDLYRTAGRLFVEGGEPYDDAVDACCADPVVAQRLTMLMIWHMQDAAKRQRQRQGGLQVRALADNERYQRALQTLANMDVAAAPTVIDELVMFDPKKGGIRHTTNRSLGATILARMSPAVLPAIEEGFAASSERHRRFYVEAVSGMRPGPEAEAVLLRWKDHGDYTVRAPALTGLAHYGDRHLGVLRGAIADDQDPFVRTQVVMHLGPFKDRQTAAAVVEFYARCEAAKDRRGIREAERTLVTMSGVRRSRGTRLLRYGLAYWRKWVLALPTTTVPRTTAPTTQEKR